MRTLPPTAPRQPILWKETVTARPWRPRRRRRCGGCRLGTATTRRRLRSRMASRRSWVCWVRMARKRRCRPPARLRPSRPITTRMSRQSRRCLWTCSGTRQHRRRRIPKARALRRRPPVAFHASQGPMHRTKMRSRAPEASLSSSSSLTRACAPSNGSRRDVPPPRSARARLTGVARTRRAFRSRMERLLEVGIAGALRRRIVRHSHRLRPTCGQSRWPSMRKAS